MIRTVHSPFSQSIEFPFCVVSVTGSERLLRGNNGKIQLHSRTTRHTNVFTGEILVEEKSSLSVQFDVELCGNLPVPYSEWTGNITVFIPGYKILLRTCMINGLGSSARKLPWVRHYFICGGYEIDTVEAEKYTTQEDLCQKKS